MVRMLRLLSQAYVVLLVAFVLAPIVSMTWFSFHGGAVQTFPIESYTTEWYERAWKHPDLRAAIATSTVVGICVATISTALGLISAHVLCRLGPRHEGSYVLLVSLPCVCPVLCSAIAILMCFGWLRLTDSIWLVIASHVGYISPFAMALLFTSYRRLNVERELAARNLGATYCQVIWGIVLPQLRPAIIAAAILAFIMSWDEFVLSWFLGGFHKTLPVVIYGMLGSAVSPMINAVGAVATLVSATGVALLLWLSRAKA